MSNDPILQSKQLEVTHRRERQEQVHGPCTPLGEQVEGVWSGNQERGNDADDAHGQRGDIALNDQLDYQCGMRKCRGRPADSRRARWLIHRWEGRRGRVQSTAWWLMVVEEEM